MDENGRVYKAVKWRANHGIMEFTGTYDGMTSLSDTQFEASVTRHLRQIFTREVELQIQPIGEWRKVT